MDHPHDRSSPVAWAERTQKTHMSSLFDMRQNKAFCPILSLLFIIREVSHARTMTHKLELDPFWARNPYSLFFLIFTFYLLIEKKRVQGSKTPTFRCNSNVLGAMTQRVQKGSKRVHFSIFVGHCPCLRGQYPIKNVFWTFSGPPLPPFFGPRIWD